MDTSVAGAPGEQRRSERMVPLGSHEDIVVLHVGGQQHVAKILDLSDGGTFVHVVEPCRAPVEPDRTLEMSLYHNHAIEIVEVKVCRMIWPAVGLEFQGLSDQADAHVQAKVLRLEAQSAGTQTTV